MVCQLMRVWAMSMPCLMLVLADPMMKLLAGSNERVQQPCTNCIACRLQQ